MANSVDPDQTAPSGAVWSGSALLGYAIQSEILKYESLEHLLETLSGLVGGLVLREKIFLIVVCPFLK